MMLFLLHTAQKVHEIGAQLLHLQELVDALQAKLPTNQVGVFSTGRVWWPNREPTFFPS